MSDINNMVKQALSSARQQEEAKKQRDLAVKRQKEQAAESQMYAMLCQLLTQEFRTSVDIQFVHNYERDKLLTSAWFEYEGIRWYIEPGYTTEECYIRILGRESYKQTKASHLPYKDLQDALLLLMGEHLEKRQKEQRIQEENNQEEERIKKNREKKNAQEAAKLQALITAEQREHEELTAQFDQVVKEAEQSMWRWPEGIAITIYKIEYCRGIGKEDEEETASFDYEERWTAAPALDSQNRIRLEPENDRYNAEQRSARTIRLTPHLHLPTWIEHTYCGTQELPNNLRKTVKVEIEGVVGRRSDTDDEYRLMRTDQLSYDEEWSSHTVGLEPLPWVKALVDEAAKR